MLSVGILDWRLEQFLSLYEKLIQQDDLLIGSLGVKSVCIEIRCLNIRIQTDLTPIFLVPRTFPMLLIRLHDVDQKLSAIMAILVVLLRSEASVAVVFMEALKGVVVKKIIKTHSNMAVRQKPLRN